MENIEIRITVDGMQQRLYTQSGYTSRSRSAMGAGDKVSDIIRITRDDNGIIKEFMSAAINEAGTVIGRFFSPYTIGRIYDSAGKETAYTICFRIPQNYPSGYAAHIGKHTEEFVLYNILRQWSMLVRPEETDIATAAMNSSVAHLQRALAARTRPIRESISPDNIIEL